MLRARGVRTLLACGASLFASTTLRAAPQPPQSQSAAELEQTLATAAPEAKLLTLMQLCEAEEAVGARKRVLFAQQAVELSRQLHKRQVEADALMLLGTAHRQLDENQEAVRLLREAEAIFEELKLPKRQFTCLKNIGWAWENAGDNERALEQYQRALELARRISYAKGEGVALSYIGIVHLEQNRYEQALECMQGALRIQERERDEDVIPNTQNYIGSIHLQLGNYDKALDYYQRSLASYKKAGDPPNMAIALGNIGIVYERTKRPREAREVYQQALDISRQFNDTVNIAGALGNLSGVYVDLGDLDKAMACREEELRISRRSGNPEHVGGSLGGLGEIYIKKKDYPGAKRVLEEALRELAKGGSNESLYSVHNNLSEVLEALGDWRGALGELKKSVALRAQILDVEKQKSLAEMEAKYESETRKQRITLLENNVEIQRLQLSRTRLRMWVLLSGAGLLLVAGVSFFRRYLHLLAFWRKKHQIGRYLIGDRIGSGGLGVVYRASDVTQRSGPVAIKLIREEFSQDPVLTRRLKHEAILIDQLNHPNIVKVYERGEHDQQIYIVMELLPDRSLAEALRGGPLAIPLVVSIGIQLADTLAAIHAKGIVHRDLKPENVMLIEQEGGPLVKLLDFDIAVGVNLTRLTETGRIMGTLHYMPPEQITDQKVLAAGDVYSMGVLLYEALTGIKPFPAELPTDIIRQILDSEAIPPLRLRRETPPELSGLLLSMLAKDPARRPDERAVCDELQRIRVSGPALPADGQESGTS